MVGFVKGVRSGSVAAVRRTCRQVVAEFAHGRTNEKGCGGSSCPPDGPPPAAKVVDLTAGGEGAGAARTGRARRARSVFSRIYPASVPWSPVLWRQLGVFFFVYTHSQC